MTSFLTKVRTLWKLGGINIAHVACYRLGIRIGLSSVRRLRASKPQGPFFRPVRVSGAVTCSVVSSWQNQALLFSNYPFLLSDEPPDWLSNPFDGKRMVSIGEHWWQICDFDPAVGDIKLIWELSRMDWTLAFAQRAHQGDQIFLNKLNDWLIDWCEHNPPFKGPNWKCGQEASIRLMHLAMSALMLEQVRTTTPGLCELVRLHLQRIAPTLQYAMAQDNNHGISEAAALFMGGSWMMVLGLPEGERWASMGRYWLENRAERLIGLQGSFSQYSLNYHRLMLDTFCMAEVWRRYLELPNFSARFHSRMLVAIEWLRHMINPFNGDGPNVGANDGARLLQLTDTKYRDYRPSVALAMALFSGQRAYAHPGPWENALHWLRIPIPEAVASTPRSYMADDGGFAVLRRGSAMAILRYPRFRFRPSQADLLHLDFWLGQNNILRDAGTYSYNTDPQWANYFGGTVSHNTIQFDERDQMPRLSRFLFGDWLKVSDLQPLIDSDEVTQFGVGYQDRRKASHYRQVSLKLGHLIIMDKIQGFTDKAVLRWRLEPGKWFIQSTSNGQHLVRNPDNNIFLSILSSAPVMRCELVKGWESRHYLEKTLVPVLEIEVQQAATLTTEVFWT